MLHIVRRHPNDEHSVVHLINSVNRFTVHLSKNYINQIQRTRSGSVVR
jgi:hypothetical protein